MTMAASTAASSNAAPTDALARALAHAPFLARQAERHPAAVEQFLAYGAEAALAGLIPPSTGSELESGLRQWRGQHALLVALGDLAGEHRLAQTCGHLSDLADRACDLALAQAISERTPDAAPQGFAVIALGKLGSRELNYSSDIDPILIFDPATFPHRSRDDVAEAAVRVGRRMMELLSARTADGHVLRVDLRLRPHPEVTPIVLPVEAAISYYESHALPWEQAAFIRSRAAAGDAALGQSFLRAIQPFIWRKSLDYRQLGEIGSMTDRIRDHYAGGQNFGPGYDLKRGRGGIREIEFFAQVHQLIYGGREGGLRVPATCDALAALAGAGRIDPAIAARLADHYALLRRIEHRLQMIEDGQTHSLPQNGDALDAVARLDGLPDGAALLGLLEPVVADVSSAYDRLVAQRGAASGWPRDPADLASAIAATGFAPVEAAAARISEWRGGTLRVLRSAAALAALEKMLPQLIAALAQAPDPEGALVRFDRMIAGLPSAVNIFHLLAAEPQLARLVTRTLVLAPTLADALGTRASLVEGLIDARAFDPPATATALADDWRRALAGRDYEDWLDGVRDRVGELRFAYGVQLVEGARDPLVIGAGYAALAEAALNVLADATIAEFERAHGRIADSELLILALGRFGGGMLTHASDLDLIYLFSGDHLAESDGPRPLGATQYYNRLAQRLTAALSVPTAAGKLYDVDTRLRPSGDQGPLVVSVDSFERYQREDAWAWEHMALLRARPVYGSAAARSDLAALLADLHRARPDAAALTAAASDMRAKISAHKGVKGPLDVKAGPGGLIDLEFAVQVTQLTHAAGLVPAMADALAQLVTAGHADPALVDAEALLTRMLILLRLAAPDCEPPTDAGRDMVAQGCGHADWQSLLAAHAAARQLVATWWGRFAAKEA
jgi:[glutamine synthetase] adenylyltransferase / [glutamine synthetase]-adenylyl-L-tyrosine phosphorylase